MEVEEDLKSNPQSVSIKKKFVMKGRGVGSGNCMEGYKMVGDIDTDCEGQLNLNKIR